MIPTLPDGFYDRPFAHRGLHDSAAGCPENSPAAIRAAVAHGYGIEIDIQRSRDDQAMVFHDYDMARLTGEAGPIQMRSAEELSDIRLSGGTDTVPTLADCLAIVGGRVPLLIEIKDQDGAMGENVGPLERSVARALEGYDGPVAVMSFNPNSVIAFGEAAPRIPRGLTTSAYTQEDWGPLPLSVGERLRDIPDFERAGACFISHEAEDLKRPRVAELKASGAAIFCWTVKSPEAEKAARLVADQITFEGYLP